MGWAFRFHSWQQTPNESHHLLLPYCNSRPGVKIRLDFIDQNFRNKIQIYMHRKTKFLMLYCISWYHFLDLEILSELMAAVHDIIHSKPPLCSPPSPFHYTGKTLQSEQTNIFEICFFCFPVFFSNFLIYHCHLS